MKDGARVAFWLTSIEERKEVPIVEGMPELGTQTQVTWKEEQFVSGIETPLIGTLLAIIAFDYSLENQSKTVAKVRA